MSTFDQFIPKGLRSIHVPPPLASYLFAVSGRLPVVTVAKLRSALLELNADSAEGRAVLK
jgi:phosphonate transport system substrate-binding protein